MPKRRDRTKPSPPVGLTTTGATEATISVSWGAASDNVAVAGYGVYRDGARLTTTTGRSYTYSGLTAGKGYVLGVDAYDAAGNRSAVTTVQAMTTGSAEPPPEPVGAKLRWAPPSLVNPITLTIPNVPTANSQRDFVLNDATDYVVRLGDYAFGGGIRFRGGRNVVLIGGRITINTNFGSIGGTTNVSSRTGLKLWPSGSSYYHIEGLEVRPDPNVDGGSDLHDGIVLQGNNSILTNSASRIVLQNCRVGPTSIRIGETDASGHSDFFQNQSENAPGFQGQIWMDHVTGLFDYSGIMLTDVCRTPLLDLHNVNLRKVPVHPSYQGHHFIYKDADDSNGAGFQVVKLDEFWGDLGGVTTWAWAYTFNPGATATGRDASGRMYAEWTGHDISGRAYQGVPPGGDFCPAGVAGLGYVSPGYL